MKVKYDFHKKEHNPLVLSTEFGHIKIVKLLLNYGINNIALNAALELCAQDGRKDIAELLLANSEIVITSEICNNMFIKSIYYNNKNITKLLLKKV